MPDADKVLYIYQLCVIHKGSTVSAVITNQRLDSEFSTPESRTRGVNFIT